MAASEADGPNRPVDITNDTTRARRRRGHLVNNWFMTSSLGVDRTVETGAIPKVERQEQSGQITWG
jgi:hypothetical protein